MGNPMLVFTGGDYMIREDLFELAVYAVKKGMRVSMTPSATPIVTKEKMARAKEVGLSRWRFSIDGPTREIHDHFRGTPWCVRFNTRKDSILERTNYAFTNQHGYITL